MRSRNLKPGFFKNEDLAELSFEERLLYAGLWCLADREGRVEDRAKRIKGELFPYDNLDVEPMLSHLAEHGFIKRYTFDDVHVIWIPKFKLHQNPHKNEKPSELPAYGIIAKLPEDSSTTRVMHRTTRADSLSSDSLFSDTPKPPKGGEKSDPRFDLFWAAYPKKADKGHARKAWTSVTKTTEPASILAGLERLLPGLKAKMQDDPHYVKNPANWLNGECWLDEPSNGNGRAPYRSASEDLPLVGPNYTCFD